MNDFPFSLFFYFFFFWSLLLLKASMSSAIEWHFDRFCVKTYMIQRLFALNNAYSQRNVIWHITSYDERWAEMFVSFSLSLSLKQFNKQETKVDFPIDIQNSHQNQIFCLYIFLYRFMIEIGNPCNDEIYNIEISTWDVCRCCCHDIQWYLINISIIA